MKGVAVAPGQNGKKVEKTAEKTPVKVNKTIGDAMQSSTTVVNQEQDKSAIAFKSSKVTAKKPLTTKPAKIVPNEAATETDVSRKSDAAKIP